MNITFSRFKDIPVVLLLKALGMVSEQEISQRVGKQTDSLIVNLYEFADIGDKNDANDETVLNDGIWDFWSVKLFH